MVVHAALYAHRGRHAAQVREGFEGSSRSSGVACDTDSGAVLGACAFVADLAVTFHAPKPVHGVLADEGVAVAIVDIGL